MTYSSRSEVENLQRGARMNQRTKGGATRRTVAFLATSPLSSRAPIDEESSAALNLPIFPGRNNQRHSARDRQDDSEDEALYKLQSSSSGNVRSAHNPQGPPLPSPSLLENVSRSSSSTVNTLQTNKISVTRPQNKAFSSHYKPPAVTSGESASQSNASTIASASTGAAAQQQVSPSYLSFSSAYKGFNSRYATPQQALEKAWELRAKTTPPTTPNVPESPFYRLPLKPVLCKEMNVQSYSEMQSGLFLGYMPFTFSQEELTNFKDLRTSSKWRVLVFSTMKQIMDSDGAVPGQNADGALTGEELIRWPEVQRVKFNDKNIKPPSYNMDHGGAPLDITEHVDVNNEKQVLLFETMELDIMPYIISIFVVESPSVEEMLSQLKVEHSVLGKIQQSKTMKTVAKNVEGQSDPPVQADASTSVTAKEEKSESASTNDENEDIVPMQETIQLRDPVSLTIIKTPVKSRQCVHVQCFDFVMHLNINRVRPMWKCPHCNGPAKWDDLFIDGFFREILENCNEDVKQVTVKSDGTWSKLRFGETERSKGRSGPFANAKGEKRKRVDGDESTDTLDNAETTSSYHEEAVIEILSD